MSKKSVLGTNLDFQEQILIRTGRGSLVHEASQNGGRLHETFVNNGHELHPEAARILDSKNPPKTKKNFFLGILDVNSLGYDLRPKQTVPLEQIFLRIKEAGHDLCLADEPILLGHQYKFKDDSRPLLVPIRNEGVITDIFDLIIVRRHMGNRCKLWGQACSVKTGVAGFSKLVVRIASK